MNGTIFNIQRLSIHDGPGLRTTVFFKGCNLHCLWCHNPESWSCKPQLCINYDRCVGCKACMTMCPNGCHEYLDGIKIFYRERCKCCGICVESCCSNAIELSGYVIAEEKLMDEIIKDRTFYEHSQGGVTFSGGECMLQIDFLESILKSCKKVGIKTAIDTAGNVPFLNFNRVMSNTDLILYDIKCATSELHANWTGTGNSRIIDNLKRIMKINFCEVWVRIPIIPGFNTDERELKKISLLLHSLPYLPKVELLPYQSWGNKKREKFNLPTIAITSPTNEEMERYRSIINLLI